MRFSRISSTRTLREFMRYSFPGKLTDYVSAGLPRDHCFSSGTSRYATTLSVATLVRVSSIQVPRPLQAASTRRFRRRPP